MQISTQNLPIFAIPFEEVDMTCIENVGGKNASIGQMLGNLSKLGLNVPSGFAITAQACKWYLQPIQNQIDKLRSEINYNDLHSLRQKGAEIRTLIRGLPLPPELENAIRESYRKICLRYGNGKNVLVAIRSSATAEDLPGKSFAGQMDTVLGVGNEDMAVLVCHELYESLYTDRVLTYRHANGFDDVDVQLSIGIQLLVRSDLSAAGNMFTCEPNTGHKNILAIEGGWGFGENIVQSIVAGDTYHFHKIKVREGFPCMIEKRLGNKHSKMILKRHEGKPTSNVSTTRKEQSNFCITDEEALLLANWGLLIEDHYGRPMDIEWAKDGKTNTLFIVQARPITTIPENHASFIDLYKRITPDEELITLVSGVAASPGFATGKAKIILDLQNAHMLEEGDILITYKTDPDWETVMHKAAAIVTAQGGTTSHGAIIARENGVPCVVGVDISKLQSDLEITVSACEGEIGKVYQGVVEFAHKKVELDSIPTTSVGIGMNLANPDEAYFRSFMPADLISLTRSEMALSKKKYHPMLAVQTDIPNNIAASAQKIITGYPSGAEFLIQESINTIGKIVAAFWPRPVIVRLTDFKTNEYEGLLGGTLFEPKEENPMLGWRGPVRYLDPRYSPAFALECEGLRRIFYDLGLDNMIIMIPMLRSPDQAKAVVEELAHFGLKQGEGGLQIYGMFETPDNCLQADKYFSVLDGGSIGSNDLTQLTLGVDRDSADVAHLFNERADSVKTLIQMTIFSAKKHSKKIGICGQAPTTFPDFAAWLVNEGISSIGFNWDAVLPGLITVAESEGQDVSQIRAKLTF
ncbi:MAG: phosphoenolpyruvate synthase [Patescibacteria group bacterium]